nr:helix-turn-helix domain-containing protein [Alteribacillus bidgolensis]
MNRPMTKGRTTKLAERIFIARDYMENNKDYQGIAERYNVSYQQEYQWTKKYEEGGEDALRDRRGRVTPQKKKRCAGDLTSHTTFSMESFWGTLK